MANINDKKLNLINKLEQENLELKQKLQSVDKKTIAYIKSLEEQLKENSKSAVRIVELENRNNELRELVRVKYDIEPTIKGLRLETLTTIQKLRRRIKELNKQNDFNRWLMDTQDAIIKGFCTEEGYKVIEQALRYYSNDNVTIDNNNKEVFFKSKEKMNLINDNHLLGGNTPAFKKQIYKPTASNENKLKSVMKSFTNNTNKDVALNKPKPLRRLDHEVRVLKFENSLKAKKEGDNE